MHVDLFEHRSNTQNTAYGALQETAQTTRRVRHLVLKNSVRAAVVYLESISNHIPENGPHHMICI